MTDPTRTPRPVLAANIERLAASAAAGEPHARMELAHATAAAVVGAGRTPEPGSSADRVVHLADTVGLETLAELWRDASPDTLPGALWTLYLLRTWCLTNGAEVARLYRAGRGLAPVDEVVAGVHDDASPEAVGALADSVLTRRLRRRSGGSAGAWRRVLPRGGRRPRAPRRGGGCGRRGVAARRA